jgi:hypothetical protein
VLWRPADGSKTTNTPRLRRESGLNGTWRKHHVSLVDPNERLGERAFRGILKALTATQLKTRTGVNHVEAGLAHDPLIKLVRIAKKAYPSWGRKKMLAHTKCFLKVLSCGVGLIGDSSEARRGEWRRRGSADGLGDGIEANAPPPPPNARVCVCACATACTCAIASASPKCPPK